MSNQDYYGGQGPNYPQHPQASYTPQGPPQQYGYQPQGYPDQQAPGYGGQPPMQYAQQPPPAKQKGSRNCLVACLAGLCFCCAVEELCECCFECCECFF